jgi:hypothetical protein
MRSVTFGATLAAAVVLSAAPVLAQGRGNSQPHGSPHATTTTQSGSHGSSGPHSSKPTTTTTSTSTSTTTTGGTNTTTTTTTTTNPIAQKIQSHPQLASKVTNMLPAGMTLAQASAGFKNQGQFIAALHVSHNLNIPFADLKKTMMGGATGTTQTVSLGQAIHKLRPTADSETATQTATTQANGDLSGK